MFAAAYIVSQKRFIYVSNMLFFKMQHVYF